MSKDFNFPPLEAVTRPFIRCSVTLVGSPLSTFTNLVANILDKTLLERTFQNKNQNKQRDANNFVMVFSFILYMKVMICITTKVSKAGKIMEKQMKDLTIRQTISGNLKVSRAYGLVKCTRGWIFTWGR